MLPSIYGQTASLAAADPSLIQAALQQTPPSTINSGSPASSDNLPTGSRDTTLTKIFVGGLPYHTTDQTLHDYFRQFGEIEEAVVITDRQTQKSRGYGFVTMKERADAEKACRDPNPIIDGRKANVNLAYLGAKPRNNVHLAALQQQLNHQLQQTQQQTPTALVQAIQLQALLQQHQQMQSIPTRLGLPINQLHAVNAPTSTFGTSLNHSTLAASQLNSLSPATLALLQQQQIATNHQAALFAAATGTAGTTGYFDYNQLLLAASSQPSASLAYNVPSAQGTSIDHGSSAASLIAANAYALHALAVAGGGSGTAHNVYKTTPKQDYE